MRVAGMHGGPEGYLLLFAWVFAEQIGLPLPAAPALLAAGALAAGESLNVVLLIAVALAASLLADSLWYRAGTAGSAAMDRFLRRHSGSRLLRNAERLVARYGSRSLLFAKFVPGLSFAAPPLSGMCGASPAQFLIFDILGSVIWIVSFAGIGYFFGSAVDIGPVRVPPRLYLWLGMALALGFGAFWCARRLFRKIRELSPAPAIPAAAVRIYNEDPERLLWLARLITGDSTGGSAATAESEWLDDAANPFFGHWMAAWSRKLVIAKAVGKVATELRQSARRAARIPRRNGFVLLPWPEGSSQRAADKFQLQRALSAIDLFPRCAVLFTVFERLSLDETAILLGAGKRMVIRAQASGLAELARNLACEQGRADESRAPSRPSLGEMQTA